MDPSEIKSSNKSIEKNVQSHKINDDLLNYTKEIEDNENVSDYFI